MSPVPAKAVTGAKNATVVFVTNQRRCVKLIELGSKIAQTSGTLLYVVHIAGAGQPADPEGLQYLFDQTSEKGGEMQVLYSENPLAELSASIRRCHALHVVTGAPDSANSVVYGLQAQFPDCIFYGTSPEKEPTKDITAISSNHQATADPTAAAAREAAAAGKRVHAIAH